ncbi:maleylpyruvate isomerase N-terminal domain-containing protein, partial [Mycobacterium sp.]
MNVREMVWAEQDELRELLAGLATDDWDQPTLCGSWKVRD